MGPDLPFLRRSKVFITDCVSEGTVGEDLETWQSPQSRPESLQPPNQLHVSAVFQIRGMLTGPLSFRRVNRPKVKQVQHDYGHLENFSNPTDQYSALQTLTCLRITCGSCLNGTSTLVIPLPLVWFTVHILSIKPQVVPKLGRTLESPREVLKTVAPGSHPFPYDQLNQCWWGAGGGWERPRHRCFLKLHR